MSEPIMQYASGITIRCEALFDVSNATELELHHTFPNGTKEVKYIADGVSLGLVDVYDEDLKKTLLAGYYVEYESEAGMFDDVGNHFFHFVYVDTTQSPVDYIPGPSAKQKVKANR